MIKVIGDEIPAPTSAGAGTNLGNATMVRCYNSGSTIRLITVTTADEAAVLGTFTLAGKQVEYVDKDITDEIFAANTNIKLTSVVVMG